MSDEMVSFCRGVVGSLLIRGAAACSIREELADDGSVKAIQVSASTAGVNYARISVVATRELIEQSEIRLSGFLAERMMSALEGAEEAIGV